MVTVGYTSFALWGVAALYLLAMLMALSATHGKIPHSLAWTQDKRTMDKWQQLRDHPSIEVPWNLIQFPTIILFGWLLLRRGASKLWPHKFAHRSKAAPVPGLDKPPSLAWAILKLLLGACALVVATVSFATMEKCVSIWNGILPNALFRALSADIVDACQNLSTKDYLDTISVIVFFFTVLGVSITLLRRGVLDISTLMLHRRVVRLEPERKRAVVTAAVAGVVALILVFYLRPARFVPNRPAAAQAEAASLGPSAVTSPPIWAAGDNATILYSGDGGRTWETRIHGTGWLYDIALVTPQLGWAVGAGGTIWHTDNGFESYKPQNSGTHSDLSVVKFTTPLLGWTVGHEGTILHTQDGGRTWQSQHSGTQTHLISLAFATSLSGWATGNDGTILHTDDGGSTWRGQSSGTTEALRGVAFATPHWGWVVGENGTILHTGDNGETWQPQNSGTVRGLAEIAAVTPQLAWAVGGKGTILHTEDGGLTWTPQFSGTRSDLVEVRFPTEQSGWAVGDDGTIVQTRDGGRRWTLQNSGTKADLRGTAFAEPGGGIGVRFNESETPDGRRSHGSAGAIIVGVVPNSPAAEAGLRTGDTIVSVNDKPVNNSDEFIAEIFPLKPGTVAKVCYVRQRKKTTANLKVGDAAKLFASQTAR
jgi:photosystem II stability/assembly factor-like uncharacterized protein